MRYSLPKSVSPVTCLMPCFLAAFVSILFLHANAFPESATADYLCQYGIQRYKEGDIADSLHELKKALIADPGNLCARNELKKIFKETAGNTDNFIVPARACINVPVDFIVKNNPNNIFFPDASYTWVFHDGTAYEGLHAKRTYDAPGEYEVLVRTQSAQFGENVLLEDSFIVKVDAPLSIDLGDDIVLCATRLPQQVSFRAAVRNDQGLILHYFWDFGDGTARQGGPETTHTYRQAGTYPVKAMVKDDSGSPCITGNDSLRVAILEPLAVSIGQDRTAYVGETITLEASDKTSLDRATLTWDLGDGATERGGTITHVYEQPGTYTVTLHARDSGRACLQETATAKVEVLTRKPLDEPLPEVIKEPAGEAPVVKAIEEPAVIKQIEPIKEAAAVRVIEETTPAPIAAPKEKIYCPGDPITFDGTGSFDKNSDKLNYFWNFGDGPTIQGPAMISHTYRDGGLYKVTLMVDDSHYTACSQAQDIATVTVNHSPKPVMRMENACCKMTPITFDASGSTDKDNDDLTYRWDFGDGESAQGITATHQYSRAGRYKVTLYANDAKALACSEASTTQTIEILDKPVAIMKVTPKTR